MNTFNINNKFNLLLALLVFLFLYLFQRRHKNPRQNPSNDEVNLFPTENFKGDRFMEQLNFNQVSDQTKIFKILVWKGVDKLHEWDMLIAKEGREMLQIEECNVQNCELTSDRSQFESSDLVIFHESSDNIPSGTEKPMGQKWMMYTIESPGYSNPFANMDWTATYRMDSTVAAPYGKWTPYDDKNRIENSPVAFDISRKTKKVAWFVSHCETSNKREDYAKELAKYIDVDVYGECGTLQCIKNSSYIENCHDILDTDYKFYLSFENSNCKDYITEKLWNILKHDIIPIVMGSSLENYKELGTLKLLSNAKYF